MIKICKSNKIIDYPKIIDIKNYSLIVFVIMKEFIFIIFRFYKNIMICLKNSLNL